MAQVYPGMVIAGRYRLDSLVGEGGMATVWRGVDLSLSREVAIKVLRDEIAAQPDAVARFRREAHAAAKLNHPNIVQVFDTGTDGNTHYIVMEYLPEPDLKRIIKDWAPLPEAKVIDVAAQCCRALAYAHRHGIIHRDVKPHNILFTDDGRAKLADFGIAAAVGTGGIGPAGTVLGSAQYMSPEQLQGSPAGPHSDLYSVGCVMYESLSGRPPFEGKTEAEVAAKHLRERPPSLRSLNPAVSTSTEFVVSKAMAREVARRYRSAEEMLADLTKLSAGEELDRTGVLAAPEGATMVLQPPPAAVRPVPAPAVSILGDELEVQPPPGARVPERPVEVAPVLRPHAPPRPSWAVPVLVTCAVILLILVGWVVKATLFPGASGKKVQVPLVEGMTPAQARQTLERDELRVGDVRFETDSAKPEGIVIAQNPPAGETVPPHSAVDLVINRGTELVMAVSVVGMTLQEAAETLARAGLTVGEVEQVYHAEVAPGRVIRQAVKPGTRLEKGASIDLTVSKGPEPTTPTGPTGVSGEPPVEDPDVNVLLDESFVPSRPGERRFIVTVTAQGQARGQTVQVVKQDDSGGRVSVLTAKLDPGVTKQVPVVTQGAATIEVLHNGRVVFHEVEPAPPSVGPENGGGSANGTAPE